MTYVNPVAEEFASGTFYEQAGTEYYLSDTKLESDYAEVRFERELRLFRKHCKTGSVLDVGCSSGGFLFQLNHGFPGCYEICGTDRSGPPLDYAESRGIPVVRGSFLDHSFTEKDFTAVTLWAVLEHLINPKQFLEKALVILKPGGLCFVLVPNMDSLAVRLLGNRYRYIYEQHLNYFARQTLKRIIPAGFSIVEERSMHWNPIVLWQDWGRGGQNVSNSDRAKLLKRTNSWKQNPLLKPVKGLYMATETVLGRLRLADNLVLVLRRKD
jgi:2-polyprenyl-3-methyl-5-hydroxy-6-metoxy-1,4-benzoquinol methylase